jgi:hypothetical protein
VVAAQGTGRYIGIMSRRIRFQPTVSEPWLDVQSLALGAVPPGKGTPDLYALVYRASAPELRIDLYADRSTQLYVYQQGLFFEEILAIGLGHEVYLVSFAEGPPRTLHLNSYFVSLHRASDAVYVVSGEDITRLNLDGDVVWTSPQLAVDGIRVELISEDTLSGEAEHDPPGDWRPFRIRTDDGRPT